MRCITLESELAAKWNIFIATINFIFKLKDTSHEGGKDTTHEGVSWITLAVKWNTLISIIYFIIDLLAWERGYNTSHTADSILAHSKYCLICMLFCYAFLHCELSICHILAKVHGHIMHTLHLLHLRNYCFSMKVSAHGYQF